MTRKTNDEPTVAEMVKAVMEINIGLYKMMAPVAIGGLIVGVPYTFSLMWVAETVSVWGGFGIVVLSLFLLLTIVPIALLMFGITMKAEEWLPWDGLEP